MRTVRVYPRTWLSGSEWLLDWSSLACEGPTRFLPDGNGWALFFD